MPNDNAKPKVDVEVSVVNHELREGLRTCLRSLPAACEGLTWRTLVVDNVSTDGSVEMLEAEFPGVRVIRNVTRLGFGENQNQVLGPALEARSARYLLVLNNDTELLPLSVLELVRFMDDHPRVGAVSPALRASTGERHDILFPFPSLLGHLRHSLFPARPPRTPGPSRPGWLNGACLILRPQALDDVGTFDTRFFMFFEDTDLQARLIRSGWSIAVCETSTVVHHSGQTVKKPEIRLQMECQFLRSRYLYFLKHHGIVQATTAAITSKVVLSARAGKLSLMPVRGRDRVRGDLHTVLALARYDPRVPLDHELFGARADRTETPNG